MFAWFRDSARSLDRTPVDAIKRVFIGGVKPPATSVRVLLLERGRAQSELVAVAVLTRLLQLLSTHRTDRSKQFIRISKSVKAFDTLGIAGL
jgi:hypothetical protein